MSSRRNFLDADDRIMERNLRFVKNDFEDNLNQYFGGSASRSNNSTNASVPPRDYKVIQPTPGGSHAQEQSNGLEKRRGFLLQLDLKRHEAYELAKNTNFDVYCLEQKYNEYLAIGFRREVINHKILSDIHNQNNWSENVTRQEINISRRTPPAPLISTLYVEKDLNFSHNEKKDRDIFFRSRSRTHTPPRKNQREELYQPARFLPNRSSNTFQERKSEEYFSRHEEYFNTRDDDVREERFRERAHSRSYSPRRFEYREENNRSSRSHSRNRELSLMQERRAERYLLQQDNFRDEIERKTICRRSHSYSPARIDRRCDYYHSSRSRSPIREINKKNLDRYVNEIRRDSTLEQSHSRPYSPPRNFPREERFHSSRSRSPNRRFSLMQLMAEEETRIQHEQNKNVKHPIYELPLSRAYSPLVIERRKEIYHSSRSRSPNRNLSSKNEERNNYISSQNIHTEKNIRRKTNYYDNSREISISNKRDFDPFVDTKKYSNNSQKQNIPSLLTLDVFSNEEHSSEENSQNRKIPSLLSLQVFPNQYDVQQPSMSNKSKLHNQESNKKRNNKNETKFVSKGKTQQITENINDNKQKPVLKKNYAQIHIIKSGLKKPMLGHLKADPQDYWSQWWPQFKYIEYSLPKINPNDLEVKSCINFLLKPNSYEYLKQSFMLLNKAVKKITQTVGIKETNYYVRDIFKLFQWKRQLEDPNFQITLNPEQLNRIAPALRQFQIKPTMAFLHQALIVRWHISLDILKKVQAGKPILSNYARTLLNHKAFHYLVMESIKELKKMCQQDWPQFNEFYRNLKANKVDIYSLGVGPDLSA